MNEQWSHWEAFPDNNNCAYFVTQINDNRKGFEIILRTNGPENREVRIVFKKSVIAYSRTGESFTNEILTYLDAHYGRNFYKDRFFYVVKNSAYLENVSKKLDERTKNGWLMHFVLFTWDDMVDIIADYEPTITSMVWDLETLMVLYKDRIVPVIEQYLPEATIILYGPRSCGKMLDSEGKVTPVQVAIDMGSSVDPHIIENLEEQIADKSAIEIRTDVIDLWAVSEKLKDQICKEGVIWKKGAL